MIYEKDKIQELIPAIWDEERVLNKRPDEAPDDDMPKAAKDPRRLDDKWAEMADIQRAWKLADLTLRERQAVLLYHGLGCTFEEVAMYGGMGRSTAVRNLDSGMAKLTSLLNEGFNPLVRAARKAAEYEEVLEMTAQPVLEFA